MGLTFRLGQIPLAIQTDTSNNVGIGGAANASFKLRVTGSSAGDSVYAIGDGASSGGALKIKQYASSAANEDGYSTISTLNTGVFYFTSASTSPNFKNFVLNPSGLTDNTLRTYTLPNASGTLALTSDLGSYLPLSGGTLTGALSGTSATFSGNLRAAKLSLGTATTTFPINVEDATQTNTYFTLFNTIGTAGATSGLRFGIANGTLTTGGATEIVSRGLTAADAAMDFKVMYNYSLVNALTLGSNGAATFSSSVTADGVGFIGVIPSYTNNFVSFSHTARSGAGDYSFLSSNDGTTIVNAKTGKTIDLRINNSSAMTITSGGAIGFNTSTPTNFGAGYNVVSNNGSSSGIYESRVNNAQGGNWGSDAGQTFMYEPRSLPITFGTANTERMRISGDGLNTFIGKNATGNFQLSVDGFGNYVFNNAIGGGYRNYLNYALATYMITSNAGNTGMFMGSGGSSWNTFTSDIRVKKNFEPTQGLLEVLQIEAVKYHMLSDEDNAPKRLGFKAQNLLPLIPEMVTTNPMALDENGDALYTITPDYLLPVLVKAIQEQQAQIEELSNKILALESK